MKAHGIPVIENLEELEKAKIGGGFWLLTGQPSDLIQCMGLQKYKFIPKRVFIVEPDERKLRDEVSNQEISSIEKQEQAKNLFKLIPPLTLAFTPR